MKSVFLLSIIAVILQANLSCAKMDCLASAGKRTTKSRILKPFTKFEILDYFNVYLKTDSINKIEIEAGQNEIGNIETDISAKNLIIKDLNACPFMKGYSEKKLYIHSDTLSNIIVHDGINLFSVDTLKQDDMNIKFLSDIGHCDLTLCCKNLFFETWFSSGDFILKGKTGYLYLYLDGLSFTNAKQLETESCYVYNNSMGDAYVRTSGILEVHIKNSGNVYYSGSPSEILLKENTGSGKLIKND
jgi:hypothetical protein